MDVHDTKDLAIRGNILLDSKDYAIVTTKFEFNGTHVKCYSDEDWAKHWFDITNESQNIIPCVTDTIPIFSVYWDFGYDSVFDW